MMAVAKQAATAPVLIYHGFYHSPEEVRDCPAAEMRYYLPAPRLAEHLDYLAANGFTGCSAEDFVHGTIDASRPVVLTFDDGHISNYEIVWPMLRARGFGATFFIVAGWLSRRGHIDAPKLRELARGGMHIGSHGLTHTRLSTLTGTALDRELVDSRKTLEDVLGRPVRHLALPGGAASREVLERALEAGYQHISTSVPGLASRGPELRRLSLTRVTSSATFRALVWGRATEIGKRRVAYELIQGAKRLVGVKNYEAVCSRLLKGALAGEPAARH